MKILWTPWRSKYIETFKEEKKGEKHKTCFLCDAINGVGEDKDRLIVARKKHCFVILNKFPYNNGHILLAPYRHIGEMNDLNNEELIELTFTLKDSVEILKKIYCPSGFNIGINLGRSAGAGLPEHLHFHVVPRWDGDTSFMATLFDVKIVSQSLEETQAILKRAFDEYLKQNI